MKQDNEEKCLTSTPNSFPLNKLQTNQQQDENTVEFDLVNSVPIINLNEESQEVGKFTRFFHELDFLKLIREEQIKSQLAKFAKALIESQQFENVHTFKACYTDKYYFYATLKFKNKNYFKGPIRQGGKVLQQYDIAIVPNNSGKQSMKLFKDLCSKYQLEGLDEKSQLFLEEQTQQYEQKEDRLLEQHQQEIQGRPISMPDKLEVEFTKLCDEDQSMTWENFAQRLKKQERNLERISVMKRFKEFENICCRSKELYRIENPYQKVNHRDRLAQYLEEHEAERYSTEKITQIQKKLDSSPYGRAWRAFILMRVFNQDPKKQSIILYGPADSGKSQTFKKLEEIFYINSGMKLKTTEMTVNPGKDAMKTRPAAWCALEDATQDIFVDEVDPKTLHSFPLDDLKVMLEGGGVRVRKMYTSPEYMYKGVGQLWTMQELPSFLDNEQDPHGAAIKSRACIFKFSEVFPKKDVLQMNYDEHVPEFPYSSLDVAHYMQRIIECYESTGVDKLKHKFIQAAHDAIPLILAPPPIMSKKRTATEAGLLDRPVWVKKVKHDIACCEQSELTFQKLSPPSEGADASSGEMQAAESASLLKDE